MYIFPSGFKGFMKYSRRSEHFGAQICNTVGTLFAKFCGILHFRTAQIAECETAYFGKITLKNIGK